MEYSDNYFREVLPKEDPPESEVPAPVMAELNELKDGEAGLRDENLLVRRSTMWTYAAFEQMRLGNFELDFNHFPFPTPLQWWVGKKRLVSHFGLFDPHFERPGYGLILDNVSSMEFFPAERELGSIYFRRLNKRFPVIQRRTETLLHAPASPANSSSACWVRDNKSLANWGFLTSGHSVSGIGIGGTVPLANGGSGQLRRSKHPPIDTAFVSTAPPSRTERGKLRNLNTISFPAAGLAVDVEATNGPQSRHVVSVFNSLGVINTFYFGIQIFLDNPCLQGDSGSLVRTASGDAVAIYSGELCGANHNGLTNQTLGLSQHFEQALLVLKVSAYV